MVRQDSLAVVPAHRLFPRHCRTQTLQVHLVQTDLVPTLDHQGHALPFHQDVDPLFLTLLRVRNLEITHSEGFEEQLAQVLVQGGEFVLSEQS